MSTEESVTTEVARVEQKDMNVIVVEAEARALLLKRVLPELLKVCNERNIRKFGDTMYIDNDGCQKIARIVGVSYSQPTMTESYKNDPETGELVYSVKMMGEASVFGQSVFEVGGATSKDKFFENRKCSWDNLCLEVLKKANANWHGRCVRTLLGIKEYTEEELAAAGFNTEKMAHTEYRQGRHSGSDKADGKEAADDMRKKVSQQIYADVNQHAEAARYVLEQVSGFEGKDGWVSGKTSVEKISDKAIAVLWRKIRPDGQERERYDKTIIDAKERFGLFADAGTEDML